MGWANREANIRTGGHARPYALNAHRNAPSLSQLGCGAGDSATLPEVLSEAGQLSELSFCLGRGRKPHLCFRCPAEPASPGPSPNLASPLFSQEAKEEQGLGLGLGAPGRACHSS